MKYIIIGDIHSRAQLLQQALKNNPEYTPIFLGDILDGRQGSESERTTNDLNTINIVLNQINLGATLIVGNHDYSLLQSDPKSWLTKSTIARLKVYPELKTFIEKVRTSVSYLELVSGNKIFHLAHSSPFKNLSTHEQIHGLKIEGQRVKWFEQKAYWPDNTIKVCGHYHSVIETSKFIVLDGDRKNNNCLPVLLIESGHHTLKTY